MKKYLSKLFAFSLTSVIVGSSAITLVSCKSKGSQNTWDDFKAKALKESATKLQSQISDIENFYWNKDDVAVFSGNGSPAQKGQQKVIMATIIIKNKVSVDSYPINFEIDYESDPYNVGDWIFSQPSNANNWSHFQDSTKQENPDSLLAMAKKSANWSQLKWYGQHIWKDSDVPEWDVYGGTSAKGDNINVMQGNLKFDDQSTPKTATVIISIKGKEGIYGAFPIKATISYDPEISYNANSWHFSAIKQLQSQPKYIEVMNQQNATIYSKIVWHTPGYSPEWKTFIITNWVDDNQTINIKSNLMNRWKKVLLFSTSKNTSFQVDNPLKDNSGISTTITFDFESVINPTGLADGTYTLSHHFNYIKNKENQYLHIGNCFNFIWPYNNFLSK